MKWIFFLLSILADLLETELENVLKKADITIFYRETCPHSQAALKTLKNKYHYNAIEESQDKNLINYVRAHYHKTFPIIFLKDELIGGNDMFQQMYKSGILDDLLAKKEGLDPFDHLFD